MPTEGEDGDVPALGGEFEDADFRARVGELGLDPDRAMLLRDIARVTPETELAVSAQIAALTRRDPAFRVRLDRQVIDNLDLDLTGEKRPETAGMMANVMARNDTNVTLRIGAEGAGLATGFGMARKVHGAGRSRGFAAPAGTFPNKIIDRVGESSFAKKQSKAMGEQAQDDVRRLKNNMKWGNLNPGIGGNKNARSGRRISRVSRT